MHLTPEQIRKLDRIKNRTTTYEAVVVRPDGREVLLSYTNRRGKRGLRHCIAKHSDALVAFVDQPAPVGMEWRRGCDEIQIDGGTIVRFSGRTRRDAIIEGELPFIGSMEKETT